MKTMKQLLYYTFFALSILCISCDAEDGADGMDGMDGINGVDGADGEQGPAGEDGNANVTSVIFNAYDITTGSNEFDIPEITQEVFDHGVVLGYVTVNGNDFWETLPIVISSDVILDIDRIFLGGLRVVSTFSQTVDFRFIIIEGMPSTRSSLLTHDSLTSYLKAQGVDISNYFEVCDFLGIDY